MCCLLSQILWHFYKVWVNMSFLSRPWHWQAKLFGPMHLSPILLLSSTVLLLNCLPQSFHLTYLLSLLTASQWVAANGLLRTLTIPYFRSMFAAHTRTRFCSEISAPWTAARTTKFIIADLIAAVAKLSYEPPYFTVVTLNSDFRLFALWLVKLTMWTHISCVCFCCTNMNSVMNLTQVA